MTLSLYTTYRAWRRAVAAERGEVPRSGPAVGPIRHAIAQLGVGLAGIACGGDASVNEASRRRG
jgi:hypothetical protein